MGRVMSNDKMTEVQNSRIERLEESVTELGKTGAETNLKVEHLGEKVQEGFAEMRASLKENFGKVYARLDEGQERFKKQDERQDKTDAALSLVQQTEQRRAERMANIRKVVIPLFTAAAGVIATKFGEQFWTWLSR